MVVIKSSWVVNRPNHPEVPRAGTYRISYYNDDLAEERPKFLKGDFKKKFSGTPGYYKFLIHKKFGMYIYNARVEFFVCILRIELHILNFNDKIIEYEIKFYIYIILS